MHNTRALLAVGSSHGRAAVGRGYDHRGQHSWQDHAHSASVDPRIISWVDRTPERWRKQVCSGFASTLLHAERCNIGESKIRRPCPAPLPQPRPSRPEGSPVVRDSRYLPCEEKCVHVSEIFLPRGAFWQSRGMASSGAVWKLPTATTNDSASASRRANGKCARAHLTHPTPTAFAFAFSVTEPLLPSPRRGGPPPAIFRRFKKSAMLYSPSTVSPS